MVELLSIIIGTKGAVFGVSNNTQQDFFDDEMLEGRSDELYPTKCKLFFLVEILGGKLDNNNLLITYLTSNDVRGVTL
jgi:hypothetical protein